MGTRPFRKGNRGVRKIFRSVLISDYDAPQGAAKTFVNIAVVFTGASRCRKSPRTPFSHSIPSCRDALCRTFQQQSHNEAPPPENERMKRSPSNVCGLFARVFIALGSYIVTNPTSRPCRSERILKRNPSNEFFSAEPHHRPFLLIPQRAASNWC